MNTNNAWLWSGSKRLNQWWYYTFWWTKLSFPFEKDRYNKLLPYITSQTCGENVARGCGDTSLFWGSWSSYRRQQWGSSLSRIAPSWCTCKKNYCKMKIPYEFSIMYSNWIQSVLWIQILLFFEPGSGIRNRFFQGAGSRIPDIKDIWDVNDNF